MDSTSLKVIRIRWKSICKRLQPFSKKKSSRNSCTHLSLYKHNQVVHSNANNLSYLATHKYTLFKCTFAKMDGTNGKQIEVIIDVASDNIGSHDKYSVGATKTLLTSILTSVTAGYFRISISFGAQALLWKILTLHSNGVSQPIHRLLRVLPSTTFLILWYISLLALFSLSFLYILKCFLHFHLVKSEFLHNIGVNYLYAPWISWLLLLQSAPMIIPNTISYQVLWWVFTAPIFVLDLKIYGQWFTTEKRFLSTVANPTSQVSVIGNLLGARAAAEMGWKECAVFMFSLGMAHYLVLFVTLYQRLAGGNRFPAMLRPTFFLFSAAPSLASLAWRSITGTFDTPSKMLFFLSFFLFMSLVILHFRITTFYFSSDIYDFSKL